MKKNDLSAVAKMAVGLLASVYVSSVFAFTPFTIPPNRDPKMTPSLNPKFSLEINPEHNQQINPKINPAINPAFKNSINPKFNQAINPQVNTTLNPKFNPALDPKFNAALDPKFNPILNPFSSPIGGPPRNQWSVLYVFNTASELTGVAIQSSNGYLLFSVDDEQYDWRGYFVGNGADGYNGFGLDGEWQTYLIKSSTPHGYNMFTRDGDWLGFLN
jgi:hypothetical protein